MNFILHFHFASRPVIHKNAVMEIVTFSESNFEVESKASKKVAFPKRFTRLRAAYI